QAGGEGQSKRSHHDRHDATSNRGISASPLAGKGQRGRRFRRRAAHPSPSRASVGHGVPVPAAAQWHPPPEVAPAPLLPPVLPPPLPPLPPPVVPAAASTPPAGGVALQIVSAHCCMSALLKQSSWQALITQPWMAWMSL